jgi:hypothetical protein
MGFPGIHLPDKLEAHAALLEVGVPAAAQGNTGGNFDSLDHVFLLKRQLKIDNFQFKNIV